MIRAIAGAVRRARASIAVMAAIYAVTIAAGMAMVHAHNRAALRFRDALVSRAGRSDPSALADRQGFYVRAAAIDFSRNLGLGAIPDTVGGLTLVLPVAFGAYRGWVGGLVSVDGSHRSRLRRLNSAAYYVVVMLLQVSGFSLAGACGLHLGRAFLRREGPFLGPSWFRLPRNALLDVAWIYAIVVPAFALGSAIEFLWH